MTLSNDIEDSIGTKTDIFDGSNWDSLYCSHLWSSSQFRKAILSAPCPDSQVIRYCYSCKGKIRKYVIKSSDSNFVPYIHSTPNRDIEPRDNLLATNELQETSFNIFSQDFPPSNPTKNIQLINNVETNQCIPTISRQVDSSFRQKYTSHEMRPNEINHRRLRKSLKGIGCIVNLALNDSSVKKRTQIQACSISVMIIAIIVISFVLVNFISPNFIRATSVASTTAVVPTKSIELNETSSAISDINMNSTVIIDIRTTDYSTTEESVKLTTEATSLISSVISKIRKNVRTFPKDTKKESLKPKEIINRDLSQRFCSCQKDEVCMLDENSGTSICRQAVDIEDPTGH
jgi:hypothetical protein